MDNETYSAECSSEQNLIHVPGIQIIFSLLYLLIFTIGLAGNALVLWLILQKKHLQNVTNFFICNLALSDILMCFFAVPFTPLQTFSGQWAFGSFLCRLCPFSQGLSVYISTLTLSLIALDRYVIIHYPYRSRMTLQTCLALICFIDVVSCCFTAPYAVHISLSNTTGLDRCQENWNGIKRTLYGAFTNLTQFVLPFLIIFFCYTSILRTLRIRSQSRPGLRSAIREEVERARIIKLNRMLISMVIIFGICWLPLNSINFIGDIYNYLYCWEYHHFAFFVCHVLAMSSTIYNPFLYGCYNESFQEEFVKMLPILKGLIGSKTLSVASESQEKRGEKDPKNILESAL